MFESYPNIEYDAKTRRINRWMKALGIAIVVLGFGGLVALGAAAEDEASDRLARVRNDTNGTMTCVGFYRVGVDDRQMRETGRIAPNSDESILYGSSCSVFDRNGDYVSCLRVRRNANVGEAAQFLASSGDRRVKADACVYPR